MFVSLHSDLCTYHCVPALFSPASNYWKCMHSAGWWWVLLGCCACILLGVCRASADCWFQCCLLLVCLSLVVASVTTVPRIIWCRWCIRPRGGTLCQVLPPTWNVRTVTFKMRWYTNYDACSLESSLEKWTVMRAQESCEWYWKCPLCCCVQLNSTVKVPWTERWSQPMKCYVLPCICWMDSSRRKSSQDKIYGNVENHLPCCVWPITIWQNPPWVIDISEHCMWADVGWSPPPTFCSLSQDVCQCLPCTWGEVCAKCIRVIDLMN